MSNNDPYAILEEAANTYGMNEQLPVLRRMLNVESGGSRTAVSPKGAGGAMQLMPETARALGVKNRFDLRENIFGGVRHFRDLMREFGGNVTLATAAYNAGSGRVRRSGGVPAIKETQDYVAKTAHGTNTPNGATRMRQQGYIESVEDDDGNMIPYEQYVKRPGSKRTEIGTESPQAPQQMLAPPPLPESIATAIAPLSGYIGDVAKRGYTEQGPAMEFKEYPAEFVPGIEGIPMPAKPEGFMNIIPPNLLANNAMNRIQNNMAFNTQYEKDYTPEQREKTERYLNSLLKRMATRYAEGMIPKTIQSRMPKDMASVDEYERYIDEPASWGAKVGPDMAGMLNYYNAGMKLGAKALSRIPDAISAAPKAAKVARSVSMMAPLSYARTGDPDSMLSDMVAIPALHAAGSLPGKYMNALRTARTQRAMDARPIGANASATAGPDISLDLDANQVNLENILLNKVDEITGQGVPRTPPIMPEPDNYLDLVTNKPAPASVTPTTQTYKPDPRFVVPSTSLADRFGAMPPTQNELISSYGATGRTPSHLAQTPAMPVTPYNADAVRAALLRQQQLRTITPQEWPGYTPLSRTMRTMSESMPPPTATEAIQRAPRTRNPRTRNMYIVPRTHAVQPDEIEAAYAAIRRGLPAYDPAIPTFPRAKKVTPGD